MHHNLRAWLLGRLDAFLTEAQRRLRPDELGRLRVLVGAALLNLVLALSNVVSPDAPENTPFTAINVVSSACYLCTLWLVRRGGSLRLSALLLCSTLTVGIGMVMHSLTNPYAATHAAGMLVPILAVYLLGARLGFLFAVLMGLNALVVFPLSRVGFDLGRPLFAEEEVKILSVIATGSLLGGWMLSWLHSSAREDAHAALRESEGRLHSLIESTDDLVCSLDREERLITVNRAVMRLVRKLTGGEPLPTASLLGLLVPEQRAFCQERFAQALAGQPQRFEVSTSPEGSPLVLDISLNPIAGADGRPVGVTLFGRDITARKQAEVRLGEMHRSLLEVSRQAGKAEIATGILHNMGNTLNSVTVSVGEVADKARGLRLAGLTRLAELLRENAADLSTFFSGDPRGRTLPAYVTALSEQLSKDQAALLTEVRTLMEGVEHIRAVVSMQQEHARAAGVLEEVPVSQLIDDALRLQGKSFERHHIQVRTEYVPVPPLLVDRHKLLQILINLLSNARHALAESGKADRRLTIRVGPGPPGRLRIEVADNGAGISPEVLPRLFSPGFTTKKDGHGFGLHMSALTAQELGGSLSCASPEPGQGATFIIELPLEARQSQV
jgi:two-component system, LuxR family, sensor kinase FixL